MAKRNRDKPRHLQAVEAIDRGLEEARQITIPDGIREGIKAGRLTPEVGKACLEAYDRASRGEPVGDVLTGEFPHGLRLCDPPEHGWERPPDDAA